MKFGAVPIAEAEGGVAVHSIRQASLVLKKGTVIGRAEIAALQAAGIPDIVVARLEPGDVSEDIAAADIAAAIAGEGVRVAPGLCSAVVAAAIWYGRRFVQPPETRAALRRRQSHRAGKRLPLLHGAQRSRQHAEQSLP